MHARPEAAWTLEVLAREAGVSRSVLAERFPVLVGHTPMQYLMNWRMEVAARRLAKVPGKISAVAFEVGYRSEAAFSRCFRERVVGISPALWRRDAASA